MELNKRFFCGKCTIKDGNSKDLHGYKKVSQASLFSLKEVNNKKKESK